MPKPKQTLEAFLDSSPKNPSLPQEDFSLLMEALQTAGKRVYQKINRAGLTDILGTAGETNVQGETQQKLDLFANDCFIETVKETGTVCGITSEENDDFIALHEKKAPRSNNFVLMMDPLDGSSNIDVSVPVGTIFSVYPRLSPKGEPIKKEDFLQPGNKQCAAGYLLYGTSTILVLSTGQGVNGFTLDPETEKFYLSHPNIKFPETGGTYSINEGNRQLLPRGVRDYIGYCQDKQDDGPQTARYIGSMVADFHRNLLKGGIYMYPQNENRPDGKLRLLYECNPIAFITEQAGGKATDGKQRILDVKPEELHQRIPFFCGNAEMVEKVNELLS